MTIAIDPKLDLVLERVVDVPPELVWRAWTTPAILKKWFCPMPWTTTECEIDLRPGGAFRTTMRSPEGELFPNVGCYLEIVENKRLVWTDALAPGFRPATPKPQGTGAPDFFLTAAINLEPHGKGTKYTAHCMHSTVSGRDDHEKMGFFDGWSTVLDQLVEVMKQK